MNHGNSKEPQKYSEYAGKPVDEGLLRRAFGSIGTHADHGEHATL